MHNLENKGQIFTQLVKIFSFAMERKFSLLLSRNLLNGQNTKAICANRPSLSGQFMTFPDMLFFLSRRIVISAVVRQAGGSPLICFARPRI